MRYFAGARHSSSHKSQRSVRITEISKGHRQKTKYTDAGILGREIRVKGIIGRIVSRKASLQMLTGCREIAAKQQTAADNAMARGLTAYAVLRETMPQQIFPDIQASLQLNAKKVMIELP